MNTKDRAAAFVVLFAFIISFIACEGRSVTTPKPQLPASTFNTNRAKMGQSEGRQCTYRVTVQTSCLSSPILPRQFYTYIFGDAYGNKASREAVDRDITRFSACKTDIDAFDGPCMDDICYLYLARAGEGEWIVTSATITGYDFQMEPVSFFYGNASVPPNNALFGINRCNATPPWDAE